MDIYYVRKRAILFFIKSWYYSRKTVFSIDFLLRKVEAIVRFCYKLLSQLWRDKISKNNRNDPTIKILLEINYC